MLLALNKISYLIIFTALALQACSSPSRYKINQDHGPSSNINVSNIKDAVPKEEPRSKYGNPKTYKVLGKWYTVRESSAGYKEKGLASWYGKKFHGHRASSGETYDMYAMTAAHKTLPLPTYVRVTHLENGRSVIVKVNDRGPFHEGRIIDLSYSAAKKLGVTDTGTAPVEVSAIDVANYKNTPPEPRFRQTYPDKTGNKLYIQVGAFSDKKNATKLYKRLTRMFKQRKIHSHFSSNKNIYRVRVGPIASIEDANKLSELLNNKGIPTTKIVID